MTQTNRDKWYVKASSIVLILCGLFCVFVVFAAVWILNTGIRQIGAAGLENVFRQIYPNLQPGIPFAICVTIIGTGLSLAAGIVCFAFRKRGKIVLIMGISYLVIELGLLAFGIYGGKTSIEWRSFIIPILIAVCGFIRMMADKRKDQERLISENNLTD